MQREARGAGSKSLGTDEEGRATVHNTIKKKVHVLEGQSKGNRG